MQALIDVILPVFLVIGFGYVAVWRGWMQDAAIDGVMKFAQNFAIPALLFRAISTLDLGQNFDPALLFSFYLGSVSGFIVGMLGARYLFGRAWEDSIVIGFIALFTNTLLLGLPITERAYGADALAANYAIIAMHAPFCYGLGITVMEVVRNRGGGTGHQCLYFCKYVWGGQTRGGHGAVVKHGSHHIYRVGMAGHFGLIGLFG